MQSIGKILSKSYQVKGFYVVVNPHETPEEAKKQKKIYELTVKQAMDKNKQLAAMGAAERFVVYIPENRNFLTTEQVINDAKVTSTESPPKTGG